MSKLNLAFENGFQISVEFRYAYVTSIFDKIFRNFFVIQTRKHISFQGILHPTKKLPKAFPQGINYIFSL